MPVGRRAAQLCAALLAAASLAAGLLALRGHAAHAWPAFASAAYFAALTLWLDGVPSARMTWRLD